MADPPVLFHDIKTLLEATTMPPLFERSTAAFWDDPYISSQMLQAHLDPSHDAASRQPGTINRTVAWIINRLGLTPGMSLLDLGCGPGLYCQRFAKAGLYVTGIDYSQSSISYAVAKAEPQHLPITYRYENYLELDDLNAYDVICLIYFDFGALTDAERACLLPRIHRALKPGGRFVFDVRTSADFAQQQEKRTWNLQSGGGFWNPGPYLELKETFLYPEAETILKQHTIVPHCGQVRTYRVWERCFSTETVSALLAQYGFSVNSYWSDLAGSAWNEFAMSIGVIAVNGDHSGHIL